MINLLFKEIMILSKTEKKARRTKFSQETNLIVGENDVGKSTLIKSLYHTLGADTPQLNNNRWKKANPIYVLKFTIGLSNFTILRDENYFGLFNENNELLGRYKGISKEGGVSDAINPLLQFNINLESKDEILRRLGSAYYFLPFYVDQDEGWNKTWTSFNGLQATKSYRTKLMDYHLGIRPQSYYDAQEEGFDLGKQNKEFDEKKNSLRTVRDSFKKKKSLQKLDIDPRNFQEEIEELVDEYSKISEEQQQLNLIKKARNEKNNLLNEIKILKKTIKELDADYSFCEAPDTADVIDCPTCGTDFENSIGERFGILDDIDYCSVLIDQRKKSLILTEEKIETLNKEYTTISKKVSSIDAILQRKKEEITFSEVIASEGYKEIINSISEDITTITSSQETNYERISELKEKQKVDRELKKKIIEYYQRNMKEALNKLNVHVLTEEDYKLPSKPIKLNALGSDLPRSLLAQYFSLLHTMNKFNEFVICPFVIDSPLQQEQDDSNVSAIFNFIFSNTLEKQQLILGTLTLEDMVEEEDVPSNCNTITLDKKYGLLNREEYQNVLEEITPLHNATLKTD